MRTDPEDPDAISSEATRLAAELIDTISHDLRTPLGSLLIWAKLLREAPADPGETSTALDMIERSASSMVAQLEALGDLRRVFSGDLRLELQSVDVAAIVRDAADAMVAEADGRGVSIGMPAPASGIVARADPRRLREALDRLLGGLVREAPRGAAIGLAIEHAGEDACRVVMTPSAGAAASPGRRLHETIAQRLIELQGGRVERARESGVVTLALPSAGDGAPTSRGTR